MDIQTKDGILLRNIPDGTPDDVIKERIAKIRGEAPNVEAEKPTDWGRKAALVGRAAFEGAFGSNPLVDLQMAPVRAVAKQFGVNIPDSSEMTKAALDKLGAYNPENAEERIIGDVSRGVTGAMAGGGALKSTLSAATAGGGP